MHRLYHYFKKDRIDDIRQQFNIEPITKKISDKKSTHRRGEASGQKLLEQSRPFPPRPISRPNSLSLLNKCSSYIQVIYLNQLAALSALSPELGLLRLIVEPKNTLPAAARGLIAQVKQSGAMEANQAQLVELIETIVIYAFPKLSCQEIAAMIEAFDIKETRFYQ